MLISLHPLESKNNVKSMGLEYVVWGKKACCSKGPPYWSTHLFLGHCHSTSHCWCLTWPFKKYKNVFYLLRKSFPPGISSPVCSHAFLAQQHTSCEASHSNLNPAIISFLWFFYTQNPFWPFLFKRTLVLCWVCLLKFFFKFFISIYFDCIGIFPISIVCWISLYYSVRLNKILAPTTQTAATGKL